VRSRQFLVFHVDREVHAFHRNCAEQDGTFPLNNPRPGCFRPVFSADFYRFGKAVLQFFAFRKGRGHDSKAEFLPEAFRVW
jgi:hypothetical protein